MIDRAIELWEAIGKPAWTLDKIHEFLKAEESKTPLTATEVLLRRELSFVELQRDRLQGEVNHIYAALGPILKINPAIPQDLTTHVEILKTERDEACLQEKKCRRDLMIANATVKLLEGRVSYLTAIAESAMRAIV